MMVQKRDVVVKGITYILFDLIKKKKNKKKKKKKYENINCFKNKIYILNNTN